MAQMNSLVDHFLIAMPNLHDPNFHHSVTYICEHNEQGAMGIVINRPMEIHLEEVLEHMGMSADSPGIGSQLIYFGGPVQQERGFVLHRPIGAWDSMMAVTGNIALTASRDVLEAIAHGQGPSDALIALGYAGWAAGQLEHEISENAWLSAPANEAILFDVPSEQRWKAAAALMGVDIDLISDEIGHA